MRRVRLTDAQVSALECRWFDPADPAEKALLDAWSGDRLAFPEEDAEAIWQALNEASNAEDDQAEQEGDPFARRAARSLYAIGRKVLR